MSIVCYIRRMRRVSLTCSLRQRRQGIPAVARSAALGVADAIIPGVTGELALGSLPGDLGDAVLRAVRPSSENMQQRWLEHFSVRRSTELLEATLGRIVDEGGIAAAHSLSGRATSAQCVSSSGIKSCLAMWQRHDGRWPMAVLSAKDPVPSSATVRRACSNRCSTGKGRGGATHRAQGEPSTDNLANGADLRIGEAIDEEPERE